ncbi:MAG: hypothetical protein IH620_05910 [Ignavibacterium sp.]|nr:hypothetical protein [Ignavibacterium sp.]
MIRVLIFILFGLMTYRAYAQDLSNSQLDSLYNLFTYIKGINFSDEMQKHLDDDPQQKKCGLGLVADIKQNLNKFSSEQQIVLSKLLDRPVLSNSTVTPNGYFRVHYDVSGINALGYDLNLLLQALDSVYNFEITYLGYPLPPSDAANGGDDKYDIYIQNLGDYGYTNPETNVGTSSWTSYMVIDNDFGNGFSTHGIDAARVTVAHEFHHAIQMGSFAPINPSEPFRGADRFFYELTSTAFEEFVFDSVNDYYAYMSSYFQQPGTAMPLNTGYNLAIWNIYLQKNFGFDIIKRQWTLIPGNAALKSIAISIDEKGSTFGNELNKFGIWTYFTNSRTISGRYFDEAANYPIISPTATVTFTPPAKFYDMMVQPVANYFLKINLPSSDGEFYSIVTNSDWQKALDNPNQFLDFSFSVFNDTVSGERPINDNYSISFNKDNQAFWNNAGILNNIVVYGDSNYSIPELDGETFAYPVPFRTSSSGNIKIAFKSKLNLGDEADINIYSAGVELYYSGKKPIQSSYIKNSIKYNEIIMNGSEINFPSGVYIYIIKSGDEIYKGKLVIFND